MAANKQKTKARRNEVRDAFAKLSATKKYKYEWIKNHLAEKYHYQPDTVEKIISTKEEDDTTQPTLF